MTPLRRTCRAGGLLGLVLATMGLTATVPAVADEDAASEVVVDSPLRFEAPEGTILELDDGRHFYATLEFLHRSGRAPVLVNELDMDTYVLGIAEMPTRWPLEALKAQAVAARTYGWYSMGLAAYDGYDLCPTVACQVFRGADMMLEADAPEQWREAVESTAGEVLLDEAGAPVLARYFSTSGGQTYPNEEVFPSDGAHDHLVGIDDPYDVVSPLHRWRVVFTTEEFNDILSRGDTLGAATPVADVERLGDVRTQTAELRVTGQDGTEVVVSARAFRDFVSRLAAQQYPDQFPPLRADGMRALPSTLPTTRFTVDVRDDEVVVSGQGWGHGVGMGQYGARGRADRGHTYDEILAAYYNGLEPTTSPDVPDRIRVGLDLTGDQTVVRPTGVVRIVAGDEVVVERALGHWTVVRHEDATWRLVPPDGHGDSLEVSPTARAAGLDHLRDAVVVEAEVNKPVTLRLVVSDADGEQVLDRDLGVGDPGRHVATWRFADADRQTVDDGTYLVAILAEDADGAVDGAPAEVEVELPTRLEETPPPTASEPDPDPAPTPSTRPDYPWLTAGLALLLALLAVWAWRAWSRRGVRRRS